MKKTLHLIAFCFCFAFFNFSSCGQRIGNPNNDENKKTEEVTFQFASINNDNVQSIELALDRIVLNDAEQNTYEVKFENVILDFSDLDKAKVSAKVIQRDYINQTLVFKETGHTITSVGGEVISFSLDQSSEVPYDFSAERGTNNQFVAFLINANRLLEAAVLSEEKAVLIDLDAVNVNNSQDYEFTFDGFNKLCLYDSGALDKENSSCAAAVRVNQGSLKNTSSERFIPFGDYYAIKYLNNTVIQIDQFKVSTEGIDVTLYSVEDPIDITPQLKDKPLANLLQNADFESGKDPWKFRFSAATGGKYTAETNSKAPEYGQMAKIVITENNSASVQLKQNNISLEPNTKYILKFVGCSEKGFNVRVGIVEDDDDYTNYGLPRTMFDLTETCSEYTLDFTTSGFDQPVSDARLAFYFPYYDTIWLDNVVLAKVPSE